MDDKKLVQLNIDDAKRNGAIIFENKTVTDVLRNKDFWSIKLNDNTIIQSKILTSLLLYKIKTR